MAGSCEKLVIDSGWGDAWRRHTRKSHEKHGAALCAYRIAYTGGCHSLNVAIRGGNVGSHANPADLETIPALQSNRLVFRKVNVVCFAADVHAVYRAMRAQIRPVEDDGFDLTFPRSRRLQSGRRFGKCRGHIREHVL